MSATTWIDAEIELGQARIRGLKQLVTDAEDIRPWLSQVEQMVMDSTLRMLDRRIASEQAKLEAHEAALRRTDA